MAPPAETPLVPWQDEQVAAIERTPAGVKLEGANTGAGGGVGAAGAAADAGGAGLVADAGGVAGGVAGTCASAWLAARSIADSAVMVLISLLVI
jgi:hypothetical protein